MRIRHYHLYSVEVVPLAAGRPVCDPARTLGMLSTEAQDAVPWFARWLGFLTTPFKRLGISGWIKTGCDAAAAGSPVRAAQHSTDGFWTIDVALSNLSIGGISAPRGRFVRIEVEPGTKAHDICARRRIQPSDVLSFGGPVLIDSDGPFLEVHPDADFSVLA